MNYKYLSKWKSEKIIKQVCRETKLALTDNNSLTKRLESIKNNNFSVEVTTQEIVNSSKIFKCSFNNIFKGYGVYRKVLLKSNKCSLLKAESFMPIKYVTGKERFIKVLGNRSLGTYILSPKRFKKHFTQYKVFDDYILRISVYKFNKKQIQVNEIFPVNHVFAGMTNLKARSKV